MAVHARWIGSIVFFTHAPELGLWQVLSRDETNWLEVKPLDYLGMVLAEMGTGGKLWVRQQDLTRTADQKETLF